jgi:hypothetical protein
MLKDMSDKIGKRASEARSTTGKPVPRLSASPSSIEPPVHKSNTPTDADGLAEAELTESAQQLIGLHLNELYGKIVAEPISEDFIRLLNELERKEKQL